MKYVVLIYCICSLVYVCRCLESCSYSDGRYTCVNNNTYSYTDGQYTITGYRTTITETYYTEPEFNECAKHNKVFYYYDLLEYRRKRSVFRQLYCPKCKRNEVRVCRNKCYCKRDVSLPNW